MNLGVTMLLGGLWHGASWNFVAWGGLHGLLLGIERALRNVVPAPPVVVRRVLVFVAVVLVWTPFKFETFPQTLAWWSAMAGLAGLGSVTLLQALGVVLFLLLVWAPPLIAPERPRFDKRELAAVAALFVAAIVIGYGQLDPSPFLYFRF